MRRHAARRAPMWPCVSFLASSSSRCPARARGRASLCQRGADVTSPHPLLAWLFLTRLLRLHYSASRRPCRPCHASAPSFRFRLLPCPLSSSHLLRNLAAHLLVARPLARFPVPAFFILRAGWVLWRSVAFLDQRKKERKKKRAFYLAAAGG